MGKRKRTTVEVTREYARRWKALAQRLRSRLWGMRGERDDNARELAALEASHTRDLVASAERYGFAIDRLQRERDQLRDERDAYGKELESDRTNVELVEECDRLRRERDEANALNNSLARAHAATRARLAASTEVRNQVLTELEQEREAHERTAAERDALEAERAFLRAEIARDSKEREALAERVRVLGGR